ncbi:MAG TPA: hypothetical protein VMR34_04370 [Candidatus Saccharimonadales bacterium]|nr:hypothetical protein [Candidatus Saccharimonadales bacterium]
MPTSSQPRKPGVKRTSAPKPHPLIPRQYDQPRPIAFAGVVGLILAYFIGSRALDTGSYWEYLFTLIFLVIAIRLMIRSLRLKF